VLELADRPALHAGDPHGRPGPIPGWGTLIYSTVGIMTKKLTKAGKKPQKRGPKEERLVITEDPAVVLARLLKPVKPKK
jgi:hypothetical protein